MIWSERKNSMSNYLIGGKIVMPKTAVPGIGYAAVCLDTENNTFGLWECDENAK